MPWIRKSQISAASDITTSALVRSATNTQTAVKDLIGSEVTGAVTAAVASSTTVINAATAAANAAVATALSDASIVTGAQNGSFMNVEGGPVYGALTDEDGYMSPFAWTPDGHVHPFGARVIGQDAAGMYESADSRFTASASDADGNLLFGVRRDGVFVTPADNLLRTGHIVTVTGSTIRVADLDTGFHATIDAGGPVTGTPTIVGKAVVFTVGGLLKWARTAGGTAYPVYANLTSWAGWGASTVAGLNTELSSLSATKGATYYNGGVGGETAEQTLARFGSRPATLGADLSVPAGTAAVVATLANVPSYSGAMSFKCTIGGIAGSLGKAAGETQPWTFTRDVAGNAATVSAGASFVSTEGVARRGNLIILNIGKNNATGTNETNMDLVGQWVWDAFNYATHLTKQVLLVGNFVDRDTSIDSPSRARIKELNEIMAVIAGDRFVDVQRELTDPGVWAQSGVTPTPEDLAAQALGCKPPSLSTDSGHFNAAGYAWLRSRVAAKLSALGWV